MSEHDHDTELRFDEDFWNERYRSSQRVWSGNPNPQLVAEAAGLAHGRALDVGCGEGADALWLAQRGWEVVATDISSVALERAAQHARAIDAAPMARIEWRHVDLLATAPEQDSFDLVSAQFMQLSPGPRARLFATLADSVRAGGTLLVVAHDLSDLATGVPRPQTPDRFYTGDDIVHVLDDSWTVVVNESRPRSVTKPDGVTTTIHDAVVVATRPAIGSTSP